MANAIFFAAIIVCFCAAGILNVLHFQMKFRLLRAGLPVKWMMMPRDDWQMWKTYYREAPARNWPLWPFYVYRAGVVVFAISGLALLMNADKVSNLLRHWIPVH